MLLARLTRALASIEARSPLSLRLCQAFGEVTGVQGAAITMGFDVSERVTLAATDAWVARMENLQDVLREGPSLDAFRSGTAVGGLTSDEQIDRWPMLCESLAEHEDFVLHAFPMKPDSIVLGVLAVYQTERRGLAVSALEAQFLADAVGIAVLGELDATAADSHDAGYSPQSWGDQDRIAAATGMVVAQLRISPANALALLRAHAFAHDATVVEVSMWVVARELDFRAVDTGDLS